MYLANRELLLTNIGNESSLMFLHDGRLSKSTDKLYITKYMHLPTFLKKALFRIGGKLYLSDAVRNATYKWAWEHLKPLRRSAIIVDIGSRDSLFPAFLAWQRFSVRVIERDTRFTERQARNGRRWHVQFIIDNCDFLAATFPVGCDAICSLFSLQHSGDEDVVAYRTVAHHLKSGGLFISATEYRHGGTRFQYGRDDGTMRIYGSEDITTRLENPLANEDMIECDRRYLRVVDAGRSVEFCNAPQQANILLLLFSKK